MNSILRGIVSIVVGILLGSAVNMGIIAVGGAIIPPPVGIGTYGADAMNVVFETNQLIFPFLAHALGTFAGAFVAALIADRHRVRFGLGIGLFFFCGGIGAVVMLNAPMWFNIVDLVFAYIPMGYLGAKLVDRK